MDLSSFDSGIQSTDVKEQVDGNLEITTTRVFSDGTVYTEKRPNISKEPYADSLREDIKRTRAGIEDSQNKLAQMEAVLADILAFLKVVDSSDTAVAPMPEDSPV